MGIGAGIFLIAVGGVLAFAVTDRISGVDLTMVGYILMGAGALGLILAVIINGQRTRTSHTVVEERRDRDPRLCGSSSGLSPEYSGWVEVVAQLRHPVAGDSGKGLAERPLGRAALEVAVGAVDIREDGVPGRVEFGTAGRRELAEDREHLLMPVRVGGRLAIDRVDRATY
jgi:hypothetical protein